MATATKIADPQMNRVYAMEAAALAGHTYHILPMRELRKLTAEVCRRYGVETARVAARTERGVWATYDWEGLICLHPRGGRNAATLAHELAHHITWQKAKRAQVHGPLFMRYYVEILDSMKLVPAVGMRSVAKKHGVRIARAA